MLDLGTLQIKISTDAAKAKKELRDFQNYTEKTEDTLDKNRAKRTRRTLTDAEREAAAKEKAAAQAAKAQKEAAKEEARAAKEAAREKAKADREAAKAAKEAAREEARAAKEAAKEKERAEKEAARAAKEAAKEAERVETERLRKLKAGFSAVKTVGVATFKAITGAIASTGAALGKLTKDALDEYATFEQLSGGAELMFGDAYSIVAKNAQNAYKTVQMSQNEYLEQVNGFAIGLKTALGDNEKAAAELAHKIIVAEADIVAATGQSQEAVQHAFEGLMRDEFTMLDNLRLGIKPTKKGFEDLIKTVNEWNKANGKATEYEIDNLADRQKALVDYIEMQELSGYAAREATTTISGTLMRLKASYRNWLLSLSQGNEQAKRSTKELAGSAVDYINKIIPVVVTVIDTLSTELPNLIKQIEPKIREAIQTWDVKGKIDQAFSKAADGIAEFDPSEKISTFIANVSKGLETGNFDELSGPEKLATTIINEMAETVGNPENWKNFITTMFTTMGTAAEMFGWNITDSFLQTMGFEHQEFVKVDYQGNIRQNGGFNRPDFAPPWQRHAAGGVYTKPTLLGNHLVAEAGYSEAIIPLKQSVLATMGAGMAAAYAGAGGRMGTTTVNNYYLNNAVVNQDKEIQDKFVSLMNEIRRKGGM